MAVGPINPNRPAPQVPQSQGAAAPRNSGRASVGADGFQAARSGGPADFLRGVWDTVTGKVNQIREIAQAAQGEPVTDAQRRELQKVFGDSLNIDDLRVVQGPRELFDNLPRETPAFTVGNKIVVNPNYYPPANDLLVHEATHSWQFQNGGLEYLPQALAAQYLGDGYDYQKAISEGKPWAELNPEQQGELIQEAYAAGVFNDPPGTLRDARTTEYAQRAREELAHGRGAAETWDIGRLTDWVKDRWDRLTPW